MEDEDLFYDTLCRVSPVSIEVIDIRNKTLVCNSGWTARHLGYTEAEFDDLSQNLFEKIVHPEDRHLQLHAFKSLFKKDHCAFRDFVMRVRRKDGNYDYLQVRITILETDAENKPLTFLNMVMDVNEVITLKQKIHRQVELLDQISFINSHELRGPVATILGLIQLIEHEEFENPNARQIIELLKRTVIKLDNVIREINQKTITT